ncbi:MAG: class I SAM-dependent methyltransferase [Verrucomicrobia bacterium]|nr:class I SAM-dependent methyltransferase [Verrucomicrobiota bacterium]
MKLRESGMPEEAYWETLFNVDLILDRLAIDGRLRDVVELGCGYGTFTLPIARRIAGVVRTCDIDPMMVARTKRRAAEVGVENIRAEQRDVFLDGFGVPPSSQDAVLLFNILHCEEPVRVLTAAARAVRPAGVVLVIHWCYDPATPRGPDLSIRPRPEQIVEWAGQTGLLDAQSPILDLPPWHYGIRFRRQAATGV